jgi:hypothetical protein
MDNDSESQWTKKTALTELNKLLEEVTTLKNCARLSEEHTRWIMKTTTFLKEVFGEDSDYFGNFTALSWKHEGQAIIGGPERPRESMNPQLGIERINNEAYQRQLQTAKGILSASKDELERKGLQSIYKGKDTKPEASMLVKVLNLAEHKLRKVIRNKPVKEVEVQEAFENLLVGADVTYSREADSIEYSTKTYRPDFTIVKADLAIDIKLCTGDDREKDIIAEINDDILAYQTKYGNVLFVVYDVGIIRDIERFVGNFEDHEGVIVKVVKH